MVYILYKKIAKSSFCRKPANIINNKVLTNDKHVKYALSAE